MEQNDQRQRRIAAENFLKSLEELEDILKENSPVKEEKPVILSSSSDSIGDSATSEVDNEIDLSVWEDAVADIEQYLQRKNKKD